MRWYDSRLMTAEELEAGALPLPATFQVGQAVDVWVILKNDKSIAIPAQVAEVRIGLRHVISYVLAFEVAGTGVLVTREFESGSRITPRGAAEPDWSQPQSIFIDDLIVHGRTAQEAMLGRHLPVLTSHTGVTGAPIDDEAERRVQERRNAFSIVGHTGSTGAPENTEDNKND